MDKIIEIMSKPWLGSILGVLGLLAAVIFYLRSRKVSRIAYQYDATSLVGTSNAAFPDELEIYFAGKPVPRVTVERIVLWNAGNTTLTRSQIVESDPLRLELQNDNASILKVDVLKRSREVNACSVNLRKNNQRIADISFDFLDPGDGIAIEMVHSGSHKDLAILGTLRGMPGGIKNYGRLTWYAENRIKKLPFPFNKMGHRFLLMVILFTGVTLIFFELLKPQIYAVFPNFFHNSQPRDPTKPYWFPIFSGLVYIATSLVLLWFRRGRYPASLDIFRFEERKDTKNETEQGASPD